MPLHQLPISRRSFLAGSGAAGVTLALQSMVRAADAQVDPHRLALLSDTHVPHDMQVSAHGVNMADNLRQAAGEIAALKPRPIGAIVNGDCAYLNGRPEDYANLAQLLDPIENVGVGVHMTLGNHDDREPFVNAMRRNDAELLEGRQVSVLEMEHANIFLLDSLRVVNEVTGALGAEQLQWLDAELRSRADKPALLFVHHNPQWTIEEGKLVTGMADTRDLFALLRRHEHVQALFYGHTHHWNISERDGVHLVNLPPVAYVFARGMPSGWLDARLGARGMTLELRCLDRAHKQHGQRVELDWRRGRWG